MRRRADADAPRREPVRFRAGDRPPLYEPAVGDQEPGRDRDLEHQRDEEVGGRAHHLLRAEDHGGDRAARERADEPERDGQPGRHRVRAGQDPARRGADQEAGGENGDDGAHPLSAADRAGTSRSIVTAGAALEGAAFDTTASTGRRRRRAPHHLVT